MDYNAKSSQPEEVHEKIKAKYAGIISRKMTVSPYDGKTYFEIMYFDESEKEWHIGYGSFAIEFVQKWLEEEFEPTYKRIDEAITDLLARAEAAEARAEKAERERDAAVKDLYRIKSCKVCNHCDSLKTLLPEVCKMCHHGDKFEWRGPKEE